MEPKTKTPDELRFKYVALSSDPKSLTAISPDLSKTLYTSALDIKPNKIVFLPEKNKFYVSSLDNDEITVFELNTFHLTKKVPIESGFKPSNMVLSKDKKVIYMVSAGSKNNKIVLFDTEKDLLINSIDTELQITDISVNSDGALILLENSGITIFDPISRMELKKIKFNLTGNYFKLINLSQNGLVFVLGEKKLLKIDLNLDNQSEYTSDIEIFDAIPLQNDIYILSDNKIKIIDSFTMLDKNKNIDIGSSNAISMAYSKDDSKIFVSDTIGKIFVFDTKQEKIINERNIETQLDKIILFE